MQILKDNLNSFRVAGHETFPCRYTWLPKIVNFLHDHPELYLDSDEGMTALGVGKNMYASMRFWAESSGLIAKDVKSNDYTITNLARLIFLGDTKRSSLDPYLENIQTSWLLHWNLSTNLCSPLFFWYFILNHWHRYDFSQTEIVDAMLAYLAKQGKDYSKSTLESTFRVFISSYCPAPNKDITEHSLALDCPFIDLNLVRRTGTKRTLMKNK